MRKAFYACDLHCHTTRSDGNDTPAELIANASKSGISVLAITDHDIKPPHTVSIAGEAMDIIEYAKQNHVQLIKGIEISCETFIDDVHIVCVGCDWDDSYFDELDLSTQDSKIKGYQELVKRLSSKGMKISWEELLYNNGKSFLDKNIQKKHIFL